MLGEQSVAAARRAGVRSTQAKSGRLRWSARPAIAGRERLARWIGASVLVQLMLAMAFIAMAALLYLAQASQASILEYNIAEMQTRQTQLMATNAGLRASATTLQSPTRIDTLASTRL